MGVVGNKCINNSYQFISNCSVSDLGRFMHSFSCKIVCEVGVIFRDHYTHYPDNSSCVSITSFGDLTFSFEVSGLIHSRVYSEVGSQGGHFRKSSNIFDFTHKHYSLKLAYPFYRSYNFYFSFKDNFSNLDKCCSYVFKRFFEMVKDFNLRYEGFFEEEIFGEFTDGRVSDFFKKLCLLGRIFMPFSFIKPCEYFIGGESCNFRWGGEVIEDFSYGNSKGVKISFKFREKDGEGGFKSYFSLDNLFNYKNPFSCEESNEFRGEIREFMIVGESEFCNCLGISFIGFGFSQGDFIEREGLEGVNYFYSKVIFDEEGSEVDVIASCRFHCDDYFISLGEISEDGEEIIKTCCIIREFHGEEDFLILPYAGGIEFILGYIYTNNSFHFSPPHFCFSRGDRECASPSILHVDTGLETQSTYSEKGRQESNSFSGLKAQEICELPAPSFSSKYKYIYFSFLEKNFNFKKFNFKTKNM